MDDFFFGMDNSYVDPFIPGASGSVTNAVSNQLNAGGPLVNPIGQQPPIGALNNQDQWGGGILGGLGFTSPQTDPHSGIGSSGPGASSTCMTSTEMNPYSVGSKSGATIGSPLGLGLTDPWGTSDPCSSTFQSSGQDFQLSGAPYGPGGDSSSPDGSVAA